MQAELASHLGLHHLDRDRVRISFGKDVAQGLFGDLEIHFAAVHRGVADHSGQGAVQLADVGGHAARHVLEHLGIGDLEALPLDLLTQDGDARLQVGAADIDDHALAEARAQALLERFELARWPVRGDDDLLVGLVERVEGVEEFDLRLLLLGQELHVVDEQHVVVAIRLFEALDAPLVGDGVDEVVGEALDRDVLDLQRRVLGQRGMSDRLDEVRLAEARIGVHEHRVVGGGGRLGHAACHGRRILVVGAYDPAVEHVARVEVGKHVVASGGRPRRSGRLVRRRRLRTWRRHRDLGLGGPRIYRYPELHLAAEHGVQGVADHAAEAALDPVAGELVGHAQHEGGAVELERHSALEPQAEGGVVHLAPEVGFGLGPDECQLVVDGSSAPLVEGCGCQPRVLGRFRRECRGGSHHPRSRPACRRRASLSTPSSAVNRAPGRRSPGRRRAPCRWPWGPLHPAP